MNTIKGKPVVGGKGAGQALVTMQPINFTSSFTKPLNMLPPFRSSIQDRTHELYRKKVKGTVLVFPACVGSTYTGMMLMQIMHDDAAPAAMIVQDADSLLTSGSVLGNVWFGKGTPIVEYKPDDLFEKIKNGDRVEVDGSTGEIKIL